MKLWSSFVKELTIAFRGFYFYVEIGMAFVLLSVLLFIVPENFNTKETEYLYLDIPVESIEKEYIDSFGDLDGKPEAVTLKAGKTEIQTRLYETIDKKIHLVDTEEELALLAQSRHRIGVAVTMSEDDMKMHYVFYLQGNETERLKSLLMIIMGQDDLELYDVVENQKVVTLTAERAELSDRENLLPVFLAFNGSLMGFFIIAAYIYLDKKEGVIKAYAVTPPPLWKYMLSKVMVLTVTMLLTSLLIIVPIMGARVNYLLLLAFLIPTGLFASGLGLVVSSYYDDMVKSFGVMYLLMICMMLPVLAYFTPSWDPPWLKLAPSYYIIFGFKEILLKGDTGFILLIAQGYLAAGMSLFGWAHSRFRRTLSV